MEIIKDRVSTASCLLAVRPYNVIIIDDNDYEDDDDVAEKDIQTINFLRYSNSLVPEIFEEDLELWLGLIAYSRNPLGPKGGTHISQRARHLYTENKKPKTKQKLRVIMYRHSCGNERAKDVSFGKLLTSTNSKHPPLDVTATYHQSTQDEEDFSYLLDL